MKICEFEDCDRSTDIRDWCSKHYVYLRSHGLIEVKGGGTCSVSDCGSAVYAKGMCRLHRDRVKSTGATDAPESIDNFSNYWVVETGCWLWLGSVGTNGYGRTSTPVHGATGAHRAMFIEHNGPLPDGVILDHLCRQPTCVNPDHLDPVTNQENIARGNNSWRFSKTCRSGRHDITDPANVYVRPGGATPGKRICRQCKLESQRRADAKSRAKKKEANLRVE